MNIFSAEARRFADQHRVARLATVDSAGEPHAIPLCCVLLGDCIYFVIDDYGEDWPQLAYLLVRGLAAIVDDHAEFEQALQQLRARYPQYAAMPLDFERNPMVRIMAKRVRLWRAAGNPTISRSSDAGTKSKSS